MAEAATVDAALVSLSDPRVTSFREGRRQPAHAARPVLRGLRLLEGQRRELLAVKLRLPGRSGASDVEDGSVSLSSAFCCMALVINSRFLIVLGYRHQ